MNPGGHKDDPFTRDLEQVEEAYRGVHPDEPPALLDQAVLNRARRAVESSSVRPWNFGWIHAVATTAVVVIAVAVVLQQPEKMSSQPGAVPDSSEYRQREEIQATSALPEEVSARKEQPDPPLLEDSLEEETFAAPVPETESADVAGDQARMRMGKAAGADPDAAPAGEAAAPAMPQPPATEALPAREALRRQAARHEETEGDRFAADAEEPAFAGQDEPAPAARDLSAEPQPAPAAIAVTAAAFESAEGEGAGEEADVRLESRPAGALSATTAAEGLRPDQANEKVTEEREAWLDRILALHQSGNREAAASELKRFRESWPEHPLPEELAAYLDEGAGD